jgi:hypothetical protein
MRLCPRVSPSGEAVSRVAERFAGGENPVVLVEPYVMLEPNRRNQRNVLCSAKQDMYYFV